MPSSYASGDRSPRRAALLAGLAAVLALPAAAGLAHAQAATTPPRIMELGIDAGAIFGLGDISSVTVDLPATRARVGLFLGRNFRWSVEPAASLSFQDAEEADARLFYNLELGALYHFRPPADLSEVGPGPQPAAAYARPFVNVTGFTGDPGDSEFSVGGGVGLKVPWRRQLAWRFEANLGYGFDNEAFRLGAFAGVSFYSRRGS
jgi:hypothetical protein